MEENENIEEGSNRKDTNESLNGNNLPNEEGLEGKKTSNIENDGEEDINKNITGADAENDEPKLNKERTKKDVQNDINAEYAFINQNQGDNHFNLGVNEKGSLPTLFVKKSIDSLRFKVMDEADQLVEYAFKEHFVTVNCAHSELGICFQQFIAHHKKFKDFKILKGSYDNSGRKDILNLIDSCRRSKIIKKDEKALLFIYDSDRKRKIPSLLKGLKDKTLEGKHGIIQRLNQEFYIIYFTYYQNVNYLDDALFDFYNVRAFDIYARTYDFSKSFIHIINEKRRKGHLSKDDEELLIDFDKNLKDQDFESKITNKGKKSIDFFEILDDETKIIESYILFVASFFPKLPPSTFREYIEILIQEKKKIRVKGKKVSLLKIWKEKADKTIRKCKLRTYRNENQIFIDFETAIEKNQCKSIFMTDFVNFTDQNVKILLEKHELFTVNASFEFHERMHPIIGEFASYQKNFYGKKLIEKYINTIEEQSNELNRIDKQLHVLIQNKKEIKRRISKLEQLKNKDDFYEFIGQIQNLRFESEFEIELLNHQLSKFLFLKEEKLPENVSIEDYLEHLESLKNKLIDKIELINSDRNTAKYYLNTYSYHFTKLLQSIHEEDESGEIVQSFFKESFSIIYNRLCIFRILNHYDTENTLIDFFDHYKIALASKTKKVRIKAVISMIEYILNNPHDFENVLNHIEKWLPSSEKEVDNFNVLEQNSISILYNSLIESVNVERDEIQNKNYELTKTYILLFENYERMERQFSIVISTLFDKMSLHKELFLFENISSDFTSLSLQIRSVMLLEYWYQILKNIEINSVNDVVDKQKVQLFIITILNELDKKKVNQIVKILRQKRSYYNRELIKSSDAKKRLTIKNERKHLIELINKLTRKES